MPASAAFFSWPLSPDPFLSLEALDFTRGRKVEAAERLGIGRNTITRKIQELHLDA